MIVIRNYHIFYQLYASNQRLKYKLGPLQNYHYTNQSGCYEVPGMNDAEEV